VRKTYTNFKLCR